MYPMWLIKRQIVVTWTTVTWKSVKMEWKSNLKPETANNTCTVLLLNCSFSSPFHSMTWVDASRDKWISSGLKKGGGGFTSCTMYHYPNCSRFDLKTGLILEEQTLRCSINCRQANHSAWRGNGLMHTDTNKLNPVCINQNVGPCLIILAHTPSRFDQSSKTH